MPKIKVDHVISFSSEDPVHVANNILSPDPAKKWKCKEAGERSATVVLQLEKASVISAIDIGNENSAYIEILVTRSGTLDDYKVLLVMSSFMSPLEARQSSNINKVRMFTKDQLSKPENEQKWDRVKIVCTQPFNRHAQYGLSFITFHTPDDKANGAPVQATIGKFLLRPDSPDNLTTGSLFARRTELQKNDKEREPLSVATAIREASSSFSPVCKPKLKIKNSTPKAKTNNDSDSEEKKPLARNRNELLYSKDEEAPNEKIDKIIEKKQSEEKEKKDREEAKEKKSREEVKEKKSREAKEKKAKEESKPRSSGESSKRKHTSESSESPKKKIKIDKNKQRKKFTELLNGVVIVISGIQNPDRASLRSMALEMGAKYKADWDNSCTHLICAFPNTPKFHLVKTERGKIVKKSWIQQCHSQRKRLPWRRFCLDKADADKPESEDEIFEEEEKTSLEIQDDSTDDEGYDDTKMQKRIEEIQAKQQEDKNKTKDIFSQDTDEDIVTLSDDDEIKNQLPDFLEFKTFFIDEIIDEDIYKTLERYIIAYKGIVAETPSEDVDFFITSEENANSYKDYNTHAVCLRPDWVWDCHNSKKFVSTDDYLL